MKDPFDDGRTLWEQTFTPAERTWLYLWAAVLAIAVLAIL
jgi:hypothetical protein